VYARRDVDSAKVVRLVKRQNATFLAAETQSFDVADVTFVVQDDSWHALLGGLYRANEHVGVHLVIGMLWRRR